MVREHLVLAGGGHSHALVLRMWAMHPARRPQALITLVSRSSTALYSGMVPGLVAGLYSREQAAIDLRGVLLEAVPLVGRGDRIRTQPLDLVGERMGHRGGGGRVGARELGDQVENPGQAFAVDGDLGGGQLEPGQVGDVLDLFCSEAHRVRRITLLA